MAVPLTDEIREQVIAMSATGMTGAEVARQLNISEPSVSKIKKAYKESEPDKWEGMRDENRKKIIDSTWRIAETLSKVLERRAINLLEHEEKLDTICTLIANSEEIGEPMKKSIIKGLSELLCPKLSELSIAWGTALDKGERGQAHEDINEASGVVIMPEVNYPTPPKEGEEDQVT